MCDDELHPARRRPGQMDEGEPGLRVPPGLVRGEEYRLRALDISSPQADAAELGQRPPELAAQIGA